MTSIIQPPPSEVLEACNNLDTLIGALIPAKDRAVDVLRRFEAPVEAAIQLNLVVRHLDGIVSLARRDMVLLPAATVLTRAGFEGGLRAWWLLAPSNDFEREARWLVGR